MPQEQLFKGNKYFLLLAFHNNLKSTMHRHVLFNCLTLQKSIAKLKLKLKNNFTDTNGLITLHNKHTKAVYSIHTHWLVNKHKSTVHSETWE